MDTVILILTFAPSSSGWAGSLVAAPVAALVDIGCRGVQ
jgi:hypothetical protein